MRYLMAANVRMFLSVRAFEGEYVDGRERYSSFIRVFLANFLAAHARLKKCLVKIPKSCRFSKVLGIWITFDEIDREAKLGALFRKM